MAASEFLVVQRIFAQIFSNVLKKLSCKFCRPFFGVTSKNGLVFLQTLDTVFEVKQRWVPFLPRFSGILPKFSEIFREREFSTIKTYTLLTPASYTTDPDVPRTIGWRASSGRSPRNPCLGTIVACQSIKVIKPQIVTHHRNTSQLR